DSQAFQLALAESEARFSAIFDQTYQYVTLLDTEGRLLEANRSAEAVIDTQAAELAGTPL
ncbi:MAG: PAS domain S-box protein, partial [Anaerolineae bacterium]|nr:PAS domain S-box protein [Anaerolineae bacterium]